MSLVFDTTSMAPGERFDGWQEAAARCFFPMAIRRRTIEPFSGRLIGHELPSIDIVRVVATPNDCLRTPRDIAARDPEQLQLHILRRGRCEVTQDDRGDVLSPGTLTTLDSSRPWAIRAVEPFELLVLAVPKVLLRPFGDTLSAATAQAIPGDAGLGGLIVPFALGLADGLEDGSIGEGRDELGETLLGLLRALAVDGRGDRSSAPAPALLSQVKAHIERHLGDPALGPGPIAAAHFITPRYLHRLFRDEGCTVSEWIRRARMERSRRDLADPALAGETILAVATRWGMPDAAHFSRLFRAAYGCSPREFRAELLEQRRA
jgi:AraC-like DNA-binding protein